MVRSGPSILVVIRNLFSLMSALLALLLAGCASTRIPRTPAAASDPEALALVTASQRAHGAAAFATMRDLKATYAGTWGIVAPRLNPILFDRRFQRESEDALDLLTGTIVRLHKGSGGRKFVFRAPGRVAVWFNGQADEREEVKRAAALAADADKMFLLGPLYFQRPGVIFISQGTTKVDGADCDQVLAVLRPGFGFAEEDRVLLSIDHATQRLRRVRTTLNGTNRTQGTEVDVTFSNWGERGGVWWATDYEQRLFSLIPLGVHRWRLLDLKANRGFAPRHPELVGEVLGAASEYPR